MQNKERCLIYFLERLNQSYELLKILILIILKEV